MVNIIKDRLHIGVQEEYTQKWSVSQADFFSDNNMLYIDLGLNYLDSFRIFPEYIDYILQV